MQVAQLHQLEAQFECELIFARGVVRVEVGDFPEGRIPKFCVAAAQREDEARGVADVEGLGAELKLDQFGHRKILED